MTPDEPTDLASISHDRPSSARSYGWILGSKDNYEVDRQSLLGILKVFPESVDAARQQRRFLYRAVRYLARDAGIRQFLDMGCGLPTENNVHEVAQAFVPDAGVVYVDIDPIVAVHGRALLADNDRTTVIQADFRDQEAVLDHPATRRLIDFSEPVAVLWFSVTHHIPDADDPRAILHAALDRAVPGSHLALSHVVADDLSRTADLDAMINSGGLPWQTRTPAQVQALVDDLEPVEPGLVELDQWRPDPDEPELTPVDEPLQPYVGASKLNRRLYHYGGVLRKP